MAGAEFPGGSGGAQEILKTSAGANSDNTRWCGPARFNPYHRAAGVAVPRPFNLSTHLAGTLHVRLVGGVCRRMGQQVDDAFALVQLQVWTHS